MRPERADLRLEGADLMTEQETFLLTFANRQQNAILLMFVNRQRRHYLLTLVNRQERDISIDIREQTRERHFY